MTRKRMLFFGMAHTAKDSRLCYFLARAIRERYPSVECLYLGKESSDPAVFSNEYLTVLPFPRGIKPNKRRYRWHDMGILAEHVRQAGIDLVQVSDARELSFGFALKQSTSIPVIFDSHEDYFNQKYEYTGKTVEGFLQGAISRAYEVLLVRYMDALFCTDDFLESFYQHPMFHAKSVAKVRNFPLRRTIRNAPVLNQRDELRLVYLGSVNRLRGVIETAELCGRFNGEPEAVRGGVTLSFHIFSKPDPIVDDLVERGLVIHYGFVPQPEFEQRIEEFDVGVCLLLRAKKFERNIPIKNFEYMAMGIPILTSNFGTMKRYVSEAGAGVMIDPTDYDQFREAVSKLSDETFRRTCGENGLAYARRTFDRDVEASVYLDTVGRLLGLRL